MAVRLVKQACLYVCTMSFWAYDDSDMISPVHRVGLRGPVTSTVYQEQRSLWLGRGLVR